MSTASEFRAAMNYGYGLRLFEYVVCFSTPFKRGDLVWNPSVTRTAPFALNYLNIWDNQEMIRQGLSPEGVYAGLVHNADKRYKRTEEQDASWIWAPMGTADGTGSASGTIRWLANYLDLEFYPFELEEKNRILRPVSEFLKGNCDLELLLNSYTALLLDGIYGELTKAYQGRVCQRRSENGRSETGNRSARINPVDPFIYSGPIKP